MGGGPVGASRQTPAEADATLASLRRLPGTTGDCDDLAGVATPPSASPFGCSLFYASGDPARPVYARNFDWDLNPAPVLHTDPPDGHWRQSLELLRSVARSHTRWSVTYEPRGGAVHVVTRQTWPAVHDFTRSS